MSEQVQVARRIAEALSKTAIQESMHWELLHIALGMDESGDEPIPAPRTKAPDTKDKHAK